MIIRGPDKDASSPGGSFIEVVILADESGVQYPHHDLIMVNLNSDDCNVHRVLVDSESSIDVLFCDVFLKMNIPLQ